MNRKWPENEDEFQEVMEEVDKELIDEGIKIPARPFHALGWLAKTFRVSFTVAGIKPTPPKDKPYSPLAISDRVHEWYSEKYGDSLLLDMSIGRMVVPVRSDPWIMRFPTIFGRFHLKCIPKSEIIYPLSATAEAEQFQSLDVLKTMPDLPEGIKSSLIEEECIQLITLFNMGYRAYSSMKKLKREDLIGEAMHDYESAVHHLTSITRSIGQAQWASLQAVEKLLKAYIAKAGGEIKYTHDLSILTSTAANIGLTPLPDELLLKVQCDPSVRYGESKLTLLDAIESHHISIVLGGMIAESLEPLAPVDRLPDSES